MEFPYFKTSGKDHFLYLRRAISSFILKLLAMSPLLNFLLWKIYWTWIERGGHLYKFGLLNYYWFHFIVVGVVEKYHIDKQTRRRNSLVPPRKKLWVISFRPILACIVWVISIRPILACIWISARMQVAFVLNFFFVQTIMGHKLFIIIKRGKYTYPYK